MNTEEHIGKTAEQEPEFVALVAIDWASSQEHVYQWAKVGGKAKTGKMESSPEAMDQWVTELTAQVGAGPIAVAMEQRRGALVAVLSKYPNLYLYPVHCN